jgi:D-tyrosyl-tRNA(Tyr) deacylase
MVKNLPGIGSIDRIVHRPGDKYVIATSRHFSQEQVEQIKKHVAGFLGEDVLVLGCDMKLQVVSVGNARRADRSKSAMKAGSISPNEARKSVGLPALSA